MLSRYRYVQKGRVIAFPETSRRLRLIRDARPCKWGLPLEKPRRITLDFSVSNGILRNRFLSMQGRCVLTPRKVGDQQREVKHFNSRCRTASMPLEGLTVDVVVLKHVFTCGSVQWLLAPNTWGQDWFPRMASV